MPLNRDNQIAGLKAVYYMKPALLPSRNLPTILFSELTSFPILSFWSIAMILAKLLSVISTMKLITLYINR
ncbi:hypothetical protein DSUL_50190 [Desulfovibrionales bacterium]